MQKKLVSLAIQITLVLAAVILFAFIDPFGILAPRKKTLVNTPVTVVSIKDIGQLVTAEYYGEVLSSLQETYIEEAENETSRIREDVKRLNDEYVQAMIKFYAEKDSLKIRWYRKKRDLTDAFTAANTPLVNELSFQTMLEAVLTKTTHDTEGALLLDLWQQTSNSRETYIKQRLILSTKDLEKIKDNAVDDLKTSRTFKKHQIIAIGRGSVKAGIDFGDFSERNFKYDEDHHEIYLLNTEVRILNADINPWFIPEKKIKGFEIIAATQRANDPAYLLKVKKSCLEKLEAQALRNGIIEQARTNAERSLRQFFSLLLDQPVAAVYIMENHFQRYHQQFAPADTIPKEQLMLLDSTLLTLDSLVRDSAYAFVKRFQSMHWHDEDQAWPISRYAYTGFKLAEDRLLTTDDSATLAQLIQTSTYTRADSIWFWPAEEYTDLYQQARQSSKAGYAGTVRFWLDSVGHTDNYVAYEESFKKLLQEKVGHAMETRRTTAKQQLLHYLTGTLEAAERENGTYIGKHITPTDTAATDSVMWYIQRFWPATKK